MATTSQIPRFIDIGVNFTDPIFRGKYRGNQKHPDDFNDVIKRSLAAGVQSVIITGGSLHESRQALDLAKQLGVFATAGCHPTRSSEFDKFKGGPKAYLNALDKLIASHVDGPGRVVAIGECGLDYDRLHFANQATQQKHFRSQLALAKKYSLPLFLHSRAAHKDFVRILTEEGFADDGGRNVGARGGVVHSFTGTADEIKELAAMGFHFSINGCGLKTAENLAAAATIPLDRLLLETDAPWCSLTTTHASHGHLAPSSSTLPKTLSALYNPQPSCKPDRFVAGQIVKGRNEPCAIGLVAHVMSQLLGVPLPELSEAVWKNTVALFGIGEGESGAGGDGGSERPAFALESSMHVIGGVEKASEPVPEFDLKKEEWPSL